MDDEQELTPEQIATYELEEKRVYAVACWLLKKDRPDEDPQRMIYHGCPIPEPWGLAYQRYEDDARELLNILSEIEG